MPLDERQIVHARAIARYGCVVIVTLLIVGAVVGVLVFKLLVGMIPS